MGGNKRFAMQFAISALVAVATPAVAAGLVAGTSVAMQTGNAAIGNAIYSTSDSDAGPQADPQQASHAPARLSVLVGNDKAAWESAHSVHVIFSRKPR
jgi:hypothetical protein